MHSQTFQISRDRLCTDEARTEKGQTFGFWVIQEDFQTVDEVCTVKWVTAYTWNSASVKNIANHMLCWIYDIHYLDLRSD